MRRNLIIDWDEWCECKKEEEESCKKVKIFVKGKVFDYGLWFEEIWGVKKKESGLPLCIHQVIIVLFGFGSKEKWKRR